MEWVRAFSWYAPTRMQKSSTQTAKAKQNKTRQGAKKKMQTLISPNNNNKDKQKIYQEREIKVRRRRNPERRQLNEGVFSLPPLCLHHVFAFSRFYIQFFCDLFCIFYRRKHNQQMCMWWCCCLCFLCFSDKTAQVQKRGAKGRRTRARGLRKKKQRRRPLRKCTFFLFCISLHSWRFCLQGQ